MSSKTIASSAVDAIIVGAGITGLSIGRELAKRGASIMIVDPNAPMTGTSAYSTECYRDVWHDSSMHSLVSRSIDLMEDLSKECPVDFGFQKNQHGYLFVSNQPGDPDADDHHFNEFAKQSTAKSIRHHVDSSSNVHYNTLQKKQTKESSKAHLNADNSDMKKGLDILWGEDLISKSFPHVHAQSALHARRAGWIDAQQLGSFLVDDIKKMGGTFMRDEVTNMNLNRDTNMIQSVQFRHSNDTVETPTLINAAGPFSGSLTKQLLPFLPDPNFTNELHCKVIFKDSNQVVPKDSPMVIVGDDNNTIPWSEDEMEWINDIQSRPHEMEAAGLTKWLSPNLPSGCHIRPASNGWNIMLWEYGHHDKPLSKTLNSVNSAMPPCTMPFFYDNHVINHVDELYAEMTMRAMSVHVPKLKQYVGMIGGNDVTTDGGYYTYAPDRMPVIGAVSKVPGYYMANGVAGYGIMASFGVADLIANHLFSNIDIDEKFNPDRLFDDILIQRMMEKINQEKSMDKAVGGSL
jgi:glycine/D-amino acid oxidase-like deaminating enzyme